MDLYQTIKQDHDNVDALFRQIDALAKDAPREIDGRFKQVKLALERHTKGEEEAFYPALRQHAETRDMVPDALQDHKEVAEMLAALSAMPKGNAAWHERFETLKESVKAHVEEEEGKIIPAAKKVIDGQRAEEILRAFEKAKQQVQAA